MTTEKQLDDIKSKSLNSVTLPINELSFHDFLASDDFNMTGRDMLSACINVCAKRVADSSDSGTADPPSEGGARGRTIEMQFERVRLEKQLLEKTSTTLEEKNRLVVATNDQLNRSNRELRDEVRNLKLENDRIRVQVRVNITIFP